MSNSESKLARELTPNKISRDDQTNKAWNDTTARKTDLMSGMFGEIPEESSRLEQSSDLRYAIRQLTE